MYESNHALQVKIRRLESGSGATMDLSNYLRLRQRVESMVQVLLRQDADSTRVILYICMHTNVCSTHAHIMYKHTDMMHKCMHTYTRTYIQCSIHAHTHTHTHTHTRTHTHTHTHTHTQT